MSILYDEGQQAIAHEARRLLEARYSKAALLDLLERQGAYDEGFWSDCREQGWTGAALPEAWGGLGLGLVEQGIIAEACGAFTVGAPLLTTSFGAGQAILVHGDEALKARWLPALASGEAAGCVAFAEGQAYAPAKPALALRGGALFGRKPAVTGALAADVAIVLAQADGAPALAAVPLKAAGVTADALSTFDNSRLAADLAFDGAAADILVKGPEAIDAAKLILARMAVMTAHEQTGGAAQLLIVARDYALERKAFGQPIGAFQSVKHRIAELYGLVELARANAIHAASRDGHSDFLAAAAAARLTAIEAYDAAARDTIQIHGGIGVTWESGLHLHQRRARSLAIEGGNGAFWEDVLVDQIMKENAA